MVAGPCFHWVLEQEAIIQLGAIIGTPAKRHLNGVSLAGRCWPAFSGICFLSPSLKNIVSVAELDFKYSGTLVRVILD